MSHDRVHKVLNFVLWFAAGGFVGSSLASYVPFLNEEITAVAVGLPVAVFVTKTSFW